MQKLFLWMLVFAPLALGASYASFSPVVVFALSLLALVPLAKFISEGTEEISKHADPAVGAFLNVTFGNATELIVGLFALRAGLLDVVRATIAGSIIGNLLLLVGTAAFVGGLRHKEQKFNRAGMSAIGTTLVLSAIALIIPAIYAQSAPAASAGSLSQLSAYVSAILLCAYFGSLLFSLRTHKHLFAQDLEEAPLWKRSTSIIVLVAATLAVAWVSDILIASIQPVVTALGWSTTFISVIFVAIAGNVAEHTSAVMAAYKNRMDLALQICMGSAAQVAQFVAPILVLASHFIAQKPLSLVFDAYELVAIVLSALIAHLVISDGESNWLEGLQLIAAYLIIAGGFYLYS